eukprot:SAG31_NODE_2793_length_5083_cov_5.043339_6_plen_56_part_01
MVVLNVVYISVVRGSKDRPITVELYPIPIFAEFLYSLSSEKNSQERNVNLVNMPNM